MATPYKLMDDEPGHYECQAEDCTQEATHVWPRAASEDEINNVAPEHRARLGDGTVSMMSCPAHAVHVHAQARTHREDCPAPDPGCVCTWDE